MKTKEILSFAAGPPARSQPLATEQDANVPQKVGGNWGGPFTARSSGDPPEIETAAAGAPAAAAKLEILHGRKISKATDKPRTHGRASLARLP
jgi:hypothetical protein